MQFKLIEFEDYQVTPPLNEFLRTPQLKPSHLFHLGFVYCALLSLSGKTGYLGFLRVYNCTVIQLYRYTYKIKTSEITVYR